MRCKNPPIKTADKKILENVAQCEESSNVFKITRAQCLIWLWDMPLALLICLCFVKEPCLLNFTPDCYERCKTSFRLLLLACSCVMTSRFPSAAAGSR